MIKTWSWIRREALWTIELTGEPSGTVKTVSGGSFVLEQYTL